MATPYALAYAPPIFRPLIRLALSTTRSFVKEKDFTVLAIEANWPESEVADRYIKTGRGSPEAALAAMYFWTWCTQKVVAMIEWMRDFNKTSIRDPRLSFTSFDMQAFSLARDYVLRYMKRYDRQNFDAVAKTYACLDEFNAGPMMDRDVEEIAYKIDSIVSLLERRRQSLINVSSGVVLGKVLQMSRIVAQAVRIRTKGVGSGYRDQMMAKNIEWIPNDAHPKEKVVLWAHNAHVSSAPHTTLRPMGSWLRSVLGSRLYVLGIAIHTDSVRAITIENGHSIGPAESAIPPASPGTDTATLSAVGEPLFFLNLKNQLGDVGRWLTWPILRTLVYPLCRFRIATNREALFAIGSLALVSAVHPTSLDLEKVFRYLSP